MCICMGLLFLMGCRKGTDMLTIEHDIQLNLPKGISKTNVLAFLDNRKIIHEPLRQVNVSSQEKISIENTHVERALIPDFRQTGLIFKTSASLQIDFQFDQSDSVLVGYSTKEIYKGL
jgi:hypothetical protein